MPHPAVPANGPTERLPGVGHVLARIVRAVRDTRPDAGSVALRHAMSHFVRCAVHLRTFRRWFHDAGNPALQRALAARPSLLTCVVHPYLNSTWRAAEKLEVVAGHYRLLSGPLAFLGVASPTGLEVAAVDDGVSVRIEPCGKFEREGELTLVLLDGARQVYWLAFTLGRLGEQRVAWIGALQGLNGSDALEVYRTLTHRLHGLRPRDLLVKAFRALCASLGVERILAVSDAMRVSTDGYFGSHAQVFASYDEAWTSSGAAAADAGFFELSPGLSERAAADIPVRKRAQYRRRYALMGDLSRQIAIAVHAGAPPAAPPA